MEIINLQIKDQQINDLLWKFLKTGIIINNKYQKTTVGVPQDNIISPILSNIYLHYFDIYIDKLKKEFDTKKISELNLEYITKSKLHSKKGVGKNKNCKELQKIKPTIRVGFKLYYARYAGDWLVGVKGSRKDVTKIREKIEIFLKEKLDLKLSIEKTKITHASKEKVQFLGYEIYLPTLKESSFAKGNVKKKASRVGIRIDAPYNKLKEQLINKNILVKKNDKWLINAVTH